MPMQAHPPPTPKQPLCSIVVPCFNEEAVIRRTHERLLTHWISGCRHLLGNVW